MDYHQPDDNNLTSLVSSYLMAQGQVGIPGRASALGISRNSSFESVTTGSCSTPSFSVGSPVTVLPAGPSDPRNEVSSTMLPSKEQLVASLSPGIGEPQLSDHSFSNDSLSYGGSMGERDSIVNCADGFWIPQDMMTDTESMLRSPANLTSLLTDLAFRFDPMLDDTADNGPCGNAFSGELECLVSSHHSTAAKDTENESSIRNTPMASAVSSAAESRANTSASPDFCHSFLVGGEEKENSSVCTNGGIAKPGQLLIPAKQPGSSFNATEQQRRLRWSDQPWMDSLQQGTDQLSQLVKQQIGYPERSPVRMPGSPTTPLDPHLFATSVHGSTSTGTVTMPHVSALREDDIQKKMPEFSASGIKRSFSAMQLSSLTTAAGNPPVSSSLVSLPKFGGPSMSTRLQMFETAKNTDKFDAAALSALLYKTQGNQEFRFHSSTDPPVSPPPPKIRRRHGTATDPQSIAARTRREKFSDRIRILQTLVPNGERLDTVSMLGQTLEYVRFLQHKVWELYNGTGDSPSQDKSEKWKEFMEHSTSQMVA